MQRVEDIEAAIDALAPEEYRRLLQWLREKEQGAWEEQLDRDSTSGKLDYLFAEAEVDAAPEALREWPPAK